MTPQEIQYQISLLRPGTSVQEFLSFYKAYKEEIKKDPSLDNYQGMLSLYRIYFKS